MMPLYDRDDRMARRKFLQDYGLDSATEKRARTEGLPWPPHKILGGRVFYSKTLVAAWFEQQPPNSRDTGQAVAGDESPVPHGQTIINGVAQ